MANPWWRDPKPGWIQTALLLALLAGGPASGQVTGNVIGIVSDAETGAPLVGAQVAIEGTNLGNVTSADGRYFINNVPVGTQGVTARYLGYRTTSGGHRVLAGQTMTVDFALTGEILEAEGIVAVIEREPLVARDNTISKSRFTAEEVRNLGVQDLDEVIEFGAGIYETVDRASRAGGFVIRGGRTTESVVFVDGALVTDFATQQTNSEVAAFTVEEVDVVTGGFGAEFGHAQSGVINIVTREGGRNFHGNLRYTTDGLFGTDGYSLQELGITFDREDLRFNRIGSPEVERCCGYNAVQASIGGPIVSEKLTFFGSVEAEGAADFFPAAAGWNPAGGGFNSDGSTETILPGNRGDRTRILGKITTFPTSTTKLTSTYLFSRDQFENYHDLTNSRTHLGPLQMLSGAATRTKTHDIILGWDQQLFQTAERNLTLQVRGNYHKTDLFSGTPLNEISAAFVEASRADCDGFCEKAFRQGDAFEEDFLNYRFGDVDFFFEDAVPADRRLLNLPQLGSRPPDVVFGVPRIFGAEGFDSQFRARQEERYGIRVDVDSQLNRVHRVKVGSEWTWITLSDRGPVYTSAIFADLYEVEPRIAALYAQDRLDYGDLVIDVGLRVDHWDPNTVFPKFPGIVPCEISAFTECSNPATNPLSQLVEAPTRTALSPRLGVAHPITDATQVRLSYGKFHQLPELQRYFDGFTTDFDAAGQNPNILYGNPNLDYIETTAFEAGITHLLSENLVLDIVGYNRDRRGALRVDVFQPGEIAEGVQERRIAVNADNGNVKGVDITLSKRYSDYFSFNLAWSLQWARGTTSGPLEWAGLGGLGRLFDPRFPGRLQPPPTELSPETFDRLNTINWLFSLRFPNDFRERTAAGAVFRDFGAYVVYNAHSGEPFTRRSTLGAGEPLEDLNRSRLPWFHQGDLRFVKGFDVAGGLGFEVFASIINFLDIENVLLVNPTTGRPDLTGFEESQSQTPVIPSEFLTEAAPSTFPFNLETDVRAEFRDGIALQDLNGDGLLTLEEARLVLREAKQASGDGADLVGSINGDSPFNYGEPRQYRFGVEIRF